MTEREKIFARIREALTVTAPLPGHHGGDVHHAPPSAAPPSARAGEWLPSVGDTFESQLARFRANAAELKADFHLLDGGGLENLLLELRAKEGWKKVASHAGDLADAACRVLALP